MAKKLELGNAARLLENTIESINNMESKDNFKLRDIPVDQIEYNDKNFYEVKEFESLKNDISENGLYHNLMVQKIEENKYRLLSGERRLRAILELGWAKAPCKIIENLSDIDAQIMLIRANDTSRVINTEDKLEQIKRIEELVEAKRRAGQKIEGTKRDEVSKMAGVSGRQYDRLKSLEKLIPEIMAMVKDGLLGESSAMQFANMDKETQKSIYKTLIDQGGKISREQAIDIKKNIGDELKKKDSEIERLQDENKRLSGSNMKLQDDIKQVHDDIKKSVNEASILKSEMAKKEGEIQTALNDLQGERKKTNPDKSHIEALEKTLKSLNDDKSIIDRQIADYQDQIENLNREKSDLQEKLLNVDKEMAENPNPWIEKNVAIGIKLHQLMSSVRSVTTDMFDIKNMENGFITDKNKAAMRSVLEFINSKFDIALED